MSMEKFYLLDPVPKGHLSEALRICYDQTYGTVNEYCLSFLDRTKSRLKRIITITSI